MYLDLKKDGEQGGVEFINPIVEKLTNARVLIENRENWSETGASIRDGSSCAMVAVFRAFGIGEYHRCLDLLALAMSKGNGGLLIGKWNDSHSHAEVLCAFDQAIELAKWGVKYVR